MQVQHRHDTRAAEYGELILGIAQVGALIPGVSRSGSP
jgi:undecaprenyl pyrophosphate phosphatase UppP